MTQKNSIDTEYENWIGNEARMGSRRAGQKGAAPGSGPDEG